MTGPVRDMVWQSLRSTQYARAFKVYFPSEGVKKISLASVFLRDNVVHLESKTSRLFWSLA